jgi:hypothetical protein
LPNNAHDSASFRSYVVQLIPESHWLIADRIDSVLPATHTNSSGLLDRINQPEAGQRKARAEGEWPADIQTTE